MFVVFSVQVLHIFVKFISKCFIFPDALEIGIVLFCGCPTEAGVGSTPSPLKICLNIETDATYMY